MRDYTEDDLRIARHKKRIQAERKAYIILAVILLIVITGAVIGLHTLFQKRPEPEPVEDEVVTVEDEPIIPVEETPEPDETGVTEAEPVEERDELDDLVDLYMASMTLEEKVYGLFIVTPEAITGVSTATRAGSATQKAIETYPVGGIIYFSKNITGKTQFKEMLLNSQKYAKYPMFIAVDEEGGTVARLANSSALGITNVGNMSDIGATLDSMNAYAAYMNIGTYLSDYGINLDFAPVADVWTNAENDTFAKRSFGSDPELVAQMVASAVTALQDQGVSATLKHFPGLGATSGDTHDSATVLDKSLDELYACELVPFAAGINAGADFVMVGHVILPPLDGEETLASMSSYVMQDLLRDQMGFDGVIITDALNMGAVTERYHSNEAAVAAIQAGADMILMPNDFPTAYQGILDAVNNGTISEERIDESLHRIYRIKYKNAIDSSTTE